MAKGWKTGGRQLGTPNKATVEARAACAALVDDPKYLHSLGVRLRSGKLSPAVECMIWYFAKGKPKERLDLQIAPDASSRKIHSANRSSLLEPLR